VVEGPGKVKREQRTMRRVWSPLLALALVLLTGCGTAAAALTEDESTSTAGAATALPAATSTSVTTPASPPTAAEAAPPTSSTTLPVMPPGTSFETVILGPSDKPVVGEDVASRIFRDEPAVAEVLKTAFAGSRAAWGGPEGNHLILSLDILGATESADGVAVYAQVWEQWDSLAGCMPVEGSGSIYPARIRLAKDRSGYRFAGADWPEDGEGYSSSLEKIFPAWLLDRVDDQAVVDLMRKASWTAAVAWAKPHVPADLLVAQPPSALPDPHGHQPPSSSYGMLAPANVDCTVGQIARPGTDDYQPEFAYPSADGRFRLFFLLSTRGVAVEDTKTGTWRSVVAPGQADMHVDGTLGFDPAWSGHTLFIDFSTWQDPEAPTVTHYEIDFDSMTVVRAVPMGPLSFNEPRE